MPPLGAQHEAARITVSAKPITIAVSTSACGSGSADPLQAVGALGYQRRLGRPDAAGLEQHEVHRRRQQRQPEQHAHEVAREDHVEPAAEQARGDEA